MYRNQSFAQQLHCVPPQIKLNDISADDSIKESLSEFVEIQNSSEALKALHADIPHILLFSGGSERKCVELAQAFAAELTSVGWDYLVIDPFDFVFLANDEFQKKLTNALNEIIISSPCVVLCENIDVLCPKRDSLSCSAQDYARCSFFLTLLNALCETGADFVLAGICENSAVLDSTFLKRVYRIYNMPMPDKKVRISCFEKEFDRFDYDNTVISYLADSTENFDLDKINRLVFGIKKKIYETLRKGGVEAPIEVQKLIEGKSIKLTKDTIDTVLSDFEKI